MKRIVSFFLALLLLMFASGATFAALNPTMLTYLALELERSSNEDMIIFADYSESKDAFTVTAQIPSMSSSEWKEIADSLKTIARAAFIDMSASILDALVEIGSYDTKVYTFLELSDGRIIDFTIKGEYYNVVD